MRIEESQFRSLVGEHQSMVFSIALRIVRERGAAEEVAQDVFVELHAALGKMESPEHVRFWLRRVAVNRATDCLRRRAARPDFQAEELDEDGYSQLQDRFGTAAAARSRAGRVDLRLQEMVSALPDAMRVPIVLRYQEDLDAGEIAAVLAQPVATVKSNLQRGLGLLRRKADVMLKEFKRERV